MSRAAMISLAALAAVLLATVLFASRLDDAPSEEAATTAALAARVASLEQEVEQLRAEVRRLRELDAPASGAPAMALRGPGPGAGAVLGSVEALARPGGDPGSRAEPAEALRRIMESGDPEAREALQALVRDELDLARGERWERRMQRRAERQQAQIEQLTVDHQLSGDQVARLEELMEDEQEQIGDLFRAAREDGSFDGARQQARELRQETDETVRDLLDEEQFAGWQEMRDERRGR